ncbi:hypothetical protein ACFQU7_01505 [Pseudoroseomonas wenyumeiae]
MTSRRAALLLPFLAAACASGDTTPPLQGPPRYDYLTPLRLNVLDIEVLEPGPGPAWRVDPPAPLSPSRWRCRWGGSGWCRSAPPAAPASWSIRPR